MHSAPAEPQKCDRVSVGIMLLSKITVNQHDRNRNGTGMQRQKKKATVLSVECDRCVCMVKSPIYKQNTRTRVVITE